MNLEKVHMSVSKCKKKNSILQRKKFYKKYAKKIISKTPWPSTAL